MYERLSIIFIDAETNHPVTFTVDEHNIIHLPEGRFTPLGDIPGGVTIKGKGAFEQRTMLDSPVIGGEDE